MSGQTLERLVYPVVDEFKMSLPRPEAFVKDPETQLFGSQSVLDSLALVSFIVAVEEKIELETGKAIRLVNDRALSMERSPFRTLNSLALYIDEMLVAYEP